MSYDEAAFRAGFAVGRLLWRPRDAEPRSDSGLGWSCDPRYLAREAGAWLCSVDTRVFNKYAAGPAVAVLSDRMISDWVGPVLISTVREYAYTTQGPGQNVTVFDWGGLTWYGSGAYHLRRGSYSSAVPVLSAEEDGNWPDDPAGAAAMMRHVLEKARVRVHRTEQED